MGLNKINQRIIEEKIPIVENRLPIYNWLTNIRGAKAQRKLKLLGQMSVAHELGIINMPLSEYTFNNIIESLDRIENMTTISYSKFGFKRQYSISTAEDYKRLLKQFFTYYEKFDNRISYSVAELLLLHSDKETQHKAIFDYEQKKKEAVALYNQIKAIKISRKNQMKKKTRAGLLTIEDYHLMVANTKSYYLKAMVTTLFFTGIRIGAIMNLKISDIDMSGPIWKLTLQDKGNTTRTIPAIEITDSIRAYLENYHPNPVPQSKLWVSANNRAYGEPIKASSVRASLRKLKKTMQKVNPDWDKDISPHHFRHSWLTRNRGVYSDHTIKRLGGWAKDSKAIYHYDHLNDNDIIQEFAGVHGINAENQSKPSWECSSCHKENLLSHTFCQCGTPQSSLMLESRKSELANQERLTKMLFDKLMADKELYARFKSFADFSATE